MTLTEGQTRVRYLLNQTDSSNTLYDNTNLIDHALNSGRRLFASILDEQYLVKLRKRSALTVTSGVGAYPSDYLKSVIDPYVTIAVSGASVVAKFLSPEERWRLRFMADMDYANAGTTTTYYYEDSSGIVLLPTSATGCSYEYIKNPTELSGTDNTELPETVDDVVVEFAFQYCLGTTRGDRELAQIIARERNLKIGALNNVYVGKL